MVGIGAAPSAVFAPASLYADTPISMPLQATSTETVTPTESSKKASQSNLECECVRWLRERHNVPIRGDADTLVPNTPLGDITIGTIVLLQYGDVSHAAMIVSTWRDELRLLEANFIPCTASERTIKNNDPHIKGFWKPPLN